MTQHAVTANRLNDGQVVYLTAESTWSERIDDCHTVDTEDRTDVLLQIAERAVADRQIVDPYLIRLDTENGEIRPLGQREFIRARGPSVRLDLGYQAGAE